MQFLPPSRHHSHCSKNSTLTHFSCLPHTASAMLSMPATPSVCTPKLRSYAMRTPRHSPLSSGNTCSFHGQKMVVIKREVNVFVHQIHEGVCMCRIPCDKHAYCPQSSQEKANLGEQLAWRPVANNLEAGIINNVALVCTTMADHKSSRRTESRLGTRERPTHMLDALNDMVDICKVLPYTAPNAAIFWDGLITPIWKFIMRRRTFNRNIIDKWDSDMGNFVLKEVYHVAMLDLHRVCVAHGNGRQAEST